jgi:AcrR family transcriptional regulator
MTIDPKDTRRRILGVAEALMRSGGPAAVTFDRVAGRLGLTKQAVIYWFPTKSDLLAEIALPGLRAEAAAVIAAVRAAATPRDAARALVQAVTRFHLDDLDRFRLLYVAPQTAPQRAKAYAFVDRVHPVTGEMYGAVAAALGDGPDARADAVALHMAALGHVLMVALTEAIDDPLAHSPARLADRLARLVADGCTA